MQPLKLQGELATRLGREIIVQSLIQDNKPLTRANYLDEAGLTEEDLTPEYEADILPEVFLLTEDGEQQPEVILEPLTLEQYEEHLGGPLSEDEKQAARQSTAKRRAARSTK